MKTEGYISIALAIAATASILIGWTIWLSIALALLSGVWGLLAGRRP
ncbi:hypothetical protein [Bifidobacterium psychraerophilum]